MTTTTPAPQATPAAIAPSTDFPIDRGRAESLNTVRGALYGVLFGALSWAAILGGAWLLFWR